jgi:hypothetical protein
VVNLFASRRVYAIQFVSSKRNDHFSRLKSPCSSQSAARPDLLVDHSKVRRRGYIDPRSIVKILHHVLDYKSDAEVASSASLAVGGDQVHSCPKLSGSRVEVPDQASTHCHPMIAGL